MNSAIEPLFTIRGHRLDLVLLLVIARSTFNTTCILHDRLGPYLIAGARIHTYMAPYLYTVVLDLPVRVRSYLYV